MQRASLLSLLALGAILPGGARQGRPLASVTAGESVTAVAPPATDEVVRSVTVRSTSLPQNELQSIVSQAELLGRQFRKPKAEQLAAMLNEWFRRRGFLASSVGAMRFEDGTLTVRCDELATAPESVHITYYKEIPNALAPPPGALTAEDLQRPTEQDRSGLNTTFVRSSGRTKPWVIARAMGLRGDQIFQWDQHRWESVLERGPFSSARASANINRDGKVQVHAWVVERPARNFVPSLTLSRGHVEGDLSFEDNNFLGTARRLFVQAAKATADPAARLKVKLSDDNFGMPGGFELEAFRSYYDPVAADGLEPAKAVDQENDLVRGARMLSRRVFSGSSDAKESIGEALTSLQPANMLARGGVALKLRDPLAFIRRRPLQQHSLRLDAESFAPIDLGGSGEDIGGLQSAVLGAPVRFGSAEQVVSLGGDWSHAANNRRWLVQGLSGLRLRLSDPTAQAYDCAPFAKLKLQLQQRCPIGQRALLRAKHCVTALTKHTPTQHELRLGGVDSVRGFAEAALGTPKAASTSRGEVLVPLPMRLQAKLPLQLTGAAFVDAALYSTGEQEKAQGTWPLRCAAAVGVGAVVGPFRCDYALTSERSTKLHVGLAQF